MKFPGKKRTGRKRQLLKSAVYDLSRFDYISIYMDVFRKHLYIYIFTVFFSSILDTDIYVSK